MVSIHWQSLPGLSHTATFSLRSGVVWVGVTSYEGEDADPCRAVQGELDTVLPMLMKPDGRYRFTFGLLARARFPLESKPIFDLLYLCVVDERAKVEKRGVAA